MPGWSELLLELEVAHAILGLVGVVTKRPNCHERATTYLVRERRKRAVFKRRNVKSLRTAPRPPNRPTVNPWLIGRNGESWPRGCQMKPQRAGSSVRWPRCQDGETGRFARLRIPKSSISKRSSPFPPIADLREKNAIFQLSEPRRRPI